MMSGSFMMMCMGFGLLLGVVLVGGGLYLFWRLIRAIEKRNVL